MQQTECKAIQFGHLSWNSATKRGATWLNSQFVADRLGNTL